MKRVIGNASLRVLTLVGKFGFVIVLASILRPEEFGEYALAAVLVSYLVYLIGLEFHTYASRVLAASDYEDWGQIYGRALLFQLGSYTLLLPVAAVILMGGGINDSYVIRVLFILFFELLAAEINWLLIASDRQISASILLLIRSVGWAAVYLISTILVPELDTVASVLNFWVAGGFVTMLLGLSLLPVRPMLFSPGDNYRIWVWQGIRQSIPMLVAVLAMRAIFTIDRVAVEQLFGKTTLAAYAFYGGISNAVMSLVDSSVLVFFFARVIRAHKDQNFQDMARMSVRMFLQCILVAAGLSILAWLLAKPLVNWMSYDIYREQSFLLVYFLLAAFLFCLSIAPNLVLFSFGRRRCIAFINLVSLATFLVGLAIIRFDPSPVRILACVCGALLLNFLAKILVAGRELRSALANDRV